MKKTFETLKYSLLDAIKLHTVEYGKPSGLLVYASNYAVGCCCIQRTDKGTENQLRLLVINCVKLRRTGLQLRKRLMHKLSNFMFAAPITVFSNHNSPTYINNCVPASAKLTRWFLHCRNLILLLSSNRFKAIRWLIVCRGWSEESDWG